MVDGFEQQVFPAGHEGGQGVDAEGLFGAEGGLPGHEVLPLDGAQEELRQRPGLGMDERTLKVDISFLPVQLRHFAHDFPVAVDVGRIVPDDIRSVGTADVEAGGIPGRGQGGFGVVAFRPRSQETGGDDFSVILGHRIRAGAEADIGRKGLQEAFRRVFLRGGTKVVLVADGQAHRSPRSAVAEDQGGRGAFRKARPGGELQRPLRGRFRLRQGFISRFVQDFDAVRHPGGGGGVEDGQQAGTRHPGRPFLPGVDGGIGDKPVGAGGSGDGNPEGSGAPAFQQAYFGRTGRSGLGNEFQVGYGAFVRKTAVFVQAGQGAPDGVAGDIHFPVGGDIDAFHGHGGRPLEDAGAEGQHRKYHPFHRHSSQKSGTSCVPPAAKQS